MSISAAEKEVFDRINTHIGGVPALGVVKVWDRVEPLLKRVVKPETGYDLYSVLTQLQLGTMQLWVIGDFQGVVVTTVLKRPLHKVFWVQFMAGSDMKNWLDDVGEVLEAYATHIGCKMIEFSGRPGWNKVRHRHPEYKQVLTVFRRALP